jgi:hypothetical protein
VTAAGFVPDATRAIGDARGVSNFKIGESNALVGDETSVVERIMRRPAELLGETAMDVIRSHRSISTCQHCGGPMPPGRPTGRTRVYCMPACRKAAYEQRRARKPNATIVKVVEVTVTERERHDIGECVEATKASPVGCRNVLLHLLDLHKSGELYSDPKWSRLIGNAYSLGVGIATHTEQVERDRGQTRWGR